MKNNLLQEKDIKLLKKFKETEYLHALDGTETVELHIYDLNGNRIYSAHYIKPETYQVVIAENSQEAILSQESIIEGNKK